MSAVVMRADVEAYAAAVRSQLDDLSPEEIEELAGGLDADLAELAAESPDPLTDRLGEPSGYAAELRSSAGLPPRTASSANRLAVIAGWRLDRQRWLGSLREQPWYPPVRDFAVVVRPVWWTLRAYVAWVVLWAAVGAGSPGLPTTPWQAAWLLAFVVLSVQLGRGLWSRFRATAPLVAVGNVIAVLAVPVLGISPVATAGAVEAVYAPSPYQVPGLVLDGEPVANLYPYDADGNPLTGVRLLDDRGRPVVTSEDSRDNWEGDGPHPFSAAVDADGTQVWNAYPLRASTDLEPGGRATVPALPEPTLPALVQPRPSPSASPPASPSDPSTAPGAEPAAPGEPGAAPPAAEPTTAPAP